MRSAVYKTCASLPGLIASFIIVVMWVLLSKCASQSVLLNLDLSAVEVNCDRLQFRPWTGRTACVHFVSKHSGQWIQLQFTSNYSCIMLKSFTLQYCDDSLLMSAKIYCLLSQQSLGCCGPVVVFKIGWFLPRDPLYRVGQKSEPQILYYT